MSTKAELQALLARVKAAKGPDRELDHAVVEVAWGKCDFGSGRYAFPPPVTASLDAITALIKRELPEWDYILEHANGGLTIRGQLGSEKLGCSAFGETDALALTAAFLSAMITKMEIEHAE